jgi:hypothetical protein
VQPLMFRTALPVSAELSGQIARAFASVLGKHLPGRIGRAVKAAAAAGAVARSASLDRLMRPGMLAGKDQWKIIVSARRYMPRPRPRLRPSSHEMPSPEAKPETVRPNSFSMMGRHGTSVNSRERSTTAYLPLMSWIDSR